MISFSSTGIFHHCYPELNSKDTTVGEKENKQNWQRLGSVLARSKSEQGVLVLPAGCSFPTHCFHAAQPLLSVSLVQMYSKFHGQPLIVLCCFNGIKLALMDK